MGLLGELLADLLAAVLLVAMVPFLALIHVGALVGQWLFAEED